MHSTTILGAAALSSTVIAQAIPSFNAGDIETAIEGVIPTPIAKLIPHVRLGLTLQTHRILY